MGVRAHLQFEIPVVTAALFSCCKRSDAVRHFSGNPLPPEERANCFGSRPGASRKASSLALRAASGRPAEHVIAGNVAFFIIDLCRIDYLFCFSDALEKFLLQLVETLFGNPQAFQRTGLASQVPNPISGCFPRSPPFACSCR